MNELEKLSGFLDFFAKGDQSVEMPTYQTKFVWILRENNNSKILYTYNICSTDPTWNCSTDPTSKILATNKFISMLKLKNKQNINITIFSSHQVNYIINTVSLNTETTKCETKISFWKFTLDKKNRFFANYKKLKINSLIMMYIELLSIILVTFCEIYKLLW